METKKSNSFVHYFVMRKASILLDDARKFKVQCQRCHANPSELSQWTFVQKTQDADMDLCKIKCPDCKRDNEIWNHLQSNEIIKILDDIGKPSFNTLFKEVITETK